ncbi:MAG: secD [Acidimicrobiales bacterium]|nr:secD [Acidimicrobiales bacterium]
MRRKLLTSLVGIIVLAAGLLATNVGLGYRPALGLDLRGGISVTLRPVDNDYTQQSLDLAVERIRERVDSKGVGEPEIIRQDNAIVVNLPGVNDRQAALDLVKVSGKVELRPVLGCYTPTPTATDTSSTSSSDVASATTTAGSTATSTGSTATSAATSDSATVGNGSTAGTGSPGPSRKVDSVPPTSDPTTIGAAVTSTTDAAGTSTTGAADTSTSAIDPGTTTTTIATFGTVLPPDQSGTLQTRDGQACSVGPSGGDGTVFEKDSAQAEIIGGGWGVTVTLKQGGAGEGVWNALAAVCYSGGTTCPSHQLAIVLDGQIQSAPTVNAPSFTGSVQITGKFTQGESSQLAQVLNSGALPVTLKAEQVENVSASLGKDSLRAALIAGAIGIALVVLFMILYYRRLAVVVVVGMLISGALVYSMTSLISRFYNGVLSLSGIAGLIVSIGVTIDSYVVFFERLKDEVRSGRSLRNSAQRGFKAAFRTILLADAVSLIGAGVLYYLSVGAVRGFAFYLGLSTLTDIFVAYYFTRPAVLLLARTKFMAGHHVLGLATDNDDPQIAGATT